MKKRKVRKGQQVTQGDLIGTVGMTGYTSCVSYTDAQIGKVLRTLDELGLSDDTIVVFTMNRLLCLK